MSLSTSIRQYFRPQQPTVTAGDPFVTYREVVPDSSLHDHIYCYWELKSKQPLDPPFIYRVVADGCIDIFFSAATDEEVYVMGFCTKYVSFPLDPVFHYIGIRFLPASFPAIFDIPARALHNQYIVLNTLLPDLSNWIEKLRTETQVFDAFVQNFDPFFSDLLSNKPPVIDPRFYRAMMIILQQRGVVQIERDLASGISPRQLRRLFDHYIGDSAKTFAQIVRFQHVLSSKPSQQCLREDKLFYDAGYYDQSHFIKAFKTLYGVTPGQAFGR